MMPQAREAILKIGPQTAQKHESTLLELQRMFAYLMVSLLLLSVVCKRLLRKYVFLFHLGI